MQSPFQMPLHIWRNVKLTINLLGVIQYKNSTTSWSIKKFFKKKIKNSISVILTCLAKLEVSYQKPIVRNNIAKPHSHFSLEMDLRRKQPDPQEVPQSQGNEAPAPHLSPTWLRTVLSWASLTSSVLSSCHLEISKPLLNIAWYVSPVMTSQAMAHSGAMWCSACCLTHSSCWGIFRTFESLREYLFSQTMVSIKKALYQVLSASE